MGNNGIEALNQKGLLNELVEGRDLTKQLYSILLKSSSSSSSSSVDESNRLNVAQKILAKIESSLTFLRHESLVESTIPIMGTLNDSPISVNGNPKSSCSEGNFIKDSTNYKVDVGKRTVVPQRTLKVEGCRKSGLEGPIEDGFSWRKYGQKDIQRAKYPRAYYKCSQREQGCFATKQVQRSEHDPTSFHVTYRKNHTCYQALSSSSPIPTNPSPKPEPTNASPPPQPLDILLCFETDAQDHTNTTHLNSPYSPSHVASNHLDANTQYTLTNLPNNNNNNNNNNNSSNNNNNNNNLFSPRVHSLEYLLDYGEIDRNFIYDDPRLFT